MSTDPEEFTGTGQTVRADPKPVAARATKPGTHSRVAIVGPRKAFEAAALETQAARVELLQAGNAHRDAERAEGSAVSEWCTLNRPEPDQVVREYLKREGEMRAANVAAGRPAGHRGPVAAHDESPITLAALARGRHAGGTAQKAGVPLRGNIARRTV